MKTIVYFTAGSKPTADELADIAALNALAEQPYIVLVANGAQNAKYGETNRLIPCDYAAGTIPTIYDAIPEFDIDSPPNPGNLPDNQGVVTDGETFAVTGGTVTIHVAAGVVTATYAVAG